MAHQGLIDILLGISLVSMNTSLQLCTHLFSSALASIRPRSMPLSRVGAATRAFVTVLFLLARRYELALEVNRDSTPERLVKAYRKLLLKAPS